MAKLGLVLALLCFLSDVYAQSISFGETNIVWTVYNGRKNVAAYLPGDPFRGPRRYGTIPWEFNRKIPYGISYHYERNTLVFSDLSRQSIYFIDTASGFWNSTKFHAGFGWVEHTAVDWLSDNLYWVDGYYEWVAMKSMDSEDVHEYKVIADANVISPRGLVVDPNREHLFWTDISRPARIVRAELDGQNQRVIAAQGLINPFDMTLRPDNGQIFWVDRSRDTLETVMSDGSGRDVIFTSHQGQPVGLSYYKDHIFLADTTFDDVVVLDMANGMGKTFFKLNQRTLGIARVLTVWSADNQPDLFTRKDLCRRKGCTQECVLKKGIPTCLCRDNFVLENGVECKQTTKIPHHALVLTNGSHICAYHLTAPQGGDVPDTLECFSEGKGPQDIESLAIDSQKMKVYYSSSQRNEIRVINLDGSGSAQFATGQKGVGGLTFDYVTGDLYWTDTTGNRIVKKKDGGEITNVHLDTNLGDLAIDPYHRVLFYIQKGQNNAVAMYALDNNTKTALSSVHADNPQRLTYDAKNQKVYWSDLGKIQAVMFDGRAEPPVGTLNIYNRAVVSYGKFLLWSTAQSNGTSLIHMYKPPDKSTYKRLRVNFPGTITDFAIFDKMRYDGKRDSCFVNNGGCQHVCIPGEKVNKCACNLGYTLNNDGKACDSNLVYDNFTFATDLMSKRVIQVNLNNGKIGGTAIGEGTLVSNVVVVGKTAYWADQNTRVIKKSNLDGSNAMSIHSTANLIIQRLAVDPGTEQIFYTASDGVKGIIGVINKNGTRQKTLIADVKFVKDIKIHSGLGLMFWVERKDTPGIERATMHGRNRMMIIRPNNNAQIFGIDIDYKENLIYWVDKNDGYIRRADFYGDAMEVVVRDKASSVTDLAIFGEHLYYTGTNSNGILRVNKNTGADAYLLAETHLIAQLHDLSIYSKTFPVPSNGKCVIGSEGCTSFCLLTNDSRVYICDCSDGDTLTGDLKKCAGDLHPDLLPIIPVQPNTARPVQFLTKSIPNNSGVTTPGPTTPAPSPGVAQANQKGPETNEDSGPNGAAIGVPIAIVLLIAIAVIVVVVLYRRRQSKRSPLVSDPRGSENPSYFNGSSNIETVKT